MNGILVCIRELQEPLQAKISSDIADQHRHPWSEKKEIRTYLCRKHSVLIMYPIIVHHDDSGVQARYEVST